MSKEQRAHDFALAMIGAYQKIVLESKIKVGDNEICLDCDEMLDLYNKIYQHVLEKFTE